MFRRRDGDGGSGGGKDGSSNDGKRDLDRRDVVALIVAALQVVLPYFFAIVVAVVLGYLVFIALF